MSPSPDVTLRLFRAEDQREAKEIILAGLEEHWGWRDAAKNPDLEDIAASYAGTVFVVAGEGERLVGTGALVPREGGVAEIVRMSVAAGARRRGIGSAILGELLARAAHAGVRRIVLETTSSWTEVVAFYLGHGFRITHDRDGDTYFALDLAPGHP